MIPDFIGLYVMLSENCCRRAIKLKSNSEKRSGESGRGGGLWHQKTVVGTVFHTNIGHFSGTECGAIPAAEGIYRDSWAPRWHHTYLFVVSSV